MDSQNDKGGTCRRENERIDYDGLVIYNEDQ